MAMKQCKECGTDISNKAKVCPKCGYKQKKRHPVLIVFAILAILIGITLSISDGSKAVDASEGMKQAAVGETVSTDKFDITVTSIERRSKVGSEFFEAVPSEGGIYIAVLVKYKNISDGPVSSFRKPSIKLSDPKDIIYDSDIDASGSYATEIDVDNKVFSDLNPGISVKEATVFEISGESLKNEGWKIYIDADKDFYVPVNF